jgi:hypothetical protein
VPLLAILVAVAGLLVSPTSSHAASSHAASSQISGASQSLLQQEHIQQARVTGQQVCAQPPAAHDPAGMSDQEVAYYGLPRRPDAASDPLGAANWLRHARLARHRDCTSHLGASLRHHQQQMQAGAEISANWAGYINTGYGYSVSNSEFIVLGLACNSGHHPYVGFWVGLGGTGNDGGGNLVQAGIEEDIDGSCHSSYSGWYQDCCALDTYAHIVGTSFALNQWAYVYVDTNYSVSGGNFYEVENLTTGAYSAANNFGYTSNGSTAEAIAERPAVGGSLTWLANFGTETFYYTHARRNGTTYYLAQQPYNSMTMQGGAIGFPATLASPCCVGTVGDFSVRWQNYW